MRLVDLFSGAGLFSGGFVQQGFRPVLAVDLSSDAIASYGRNIAQVGRCGSVADLDRLPDCEVLIAGPPCQGFSTLGRRDPLDERNALAFEVVRLAATNPPHVVVVENVPPFLRSESWSRIRDGLIALGFEVTTWELDAADYGTPQFRRRSFTVASRVGMPKVPRVTGAAVPARTVLARPVDPSDSLHRWPTPTPLAEGRMRLIPRGGDKRDLMRAAPDLCPPSWKEVGCQATDVWGRIHPDKPANTLRCAFQNPSKGRYIHPTANRVISLREGARLQGVPDDWQFIGRNYPVARQIGNGVPVPLAKAVASSIRKLFEEQSRSAA